VNFKWERTWAGVLLMSCALAAHAADRPAAKQAKSPQPDLDFLEYLGTLENDEDNWTDVMTMDLPNAASSAAKPAKATGKVSDTNATKGKVKAETAAKGADSEK